MKYTKNRPRNAQILLLQNSQKTLYLSIDNYFSIFVGSVKEEGERMLPLINLFLLYIQLLNRDEERQARLLITTKRKIFFELTWKKYLQKLSS